MRTLWSQGDFGALARKAVEKLRRIRPADGTASLSLLMDLVPGREGSGVTDPYYGADDGFAETWSDVSAVATALVADATGSSG